MKIARRVEEALEELEKEAKVDSRPGMVEGYKRIRDIKVFNEEEEKKKKMVAAAVGKPTK